MSMQNHSPDIPTTRRKPGARLQTGFGLVQVMLILVLVGSALAAGALLLQSKRAPQQAVSQEQTLRWADEAVAAFAASNARLPCPSPTVHGEEDCSGVRAQGWLPLRTLLGASGTAPGIGPVAYMVYRGGETAHLDLTRPGNAYQPPLVDGSTRHIITKDKDGEETSRRAFAAVNGLDFCRSLELAETAGVDASLARIRVQAGGERNVAYGVAAAGAQSGTTRLDGANAGSGQTMEAPWQEWNSGYDDRVRVRTFNSLGQTLGCRLLAGGTGPSSSSPYNVSAAGMDVLAAAVTLHDALALLQANNIDATESAVDGAVKAQISLIYKLVTTAVSLSDQITTLVTSSVNLVRSIATCIASLGATCWEVPLKTAAVVTSIVGLGTKGVTLAAKAASLPFVALALDASIKARDLAKQNGPKAPPQNLEEARKELECTLWARNCAEPNETRVVYRTDKNGDPVPETDVDGNQLYDQYGNPRYQIESETEVPRLGLEKQTRLREQEWLKLQGQVDVIEKWRLEPWGRGAGEDGSLVEVTSTGLDNKSRSRIQERIDPERTCGSDDMGKCPVRYRKTIETWTCPHVGANRGQYDLRGGECVHVGMETVTIDEVEETRPAGAHDHVRKTSYEFDWDVATADAIARRRKAEEWTDLNRREGELDKEIKQFENNIKAWFEGGDSILVKMRNQRDDAQHCGGRSEPALPSGDKERQQCINAREAVRYIETCEKPKVETRCRFLGSGTGRYVNDTCTQRDGTDASGSALPKDYGLQETTTDVYERDTNPLASCKPNMEDRRDALKLELAGLAGNRAAAASAYDSLPSPWVAYPTPQQPIPDHPTHNWFEWALEVTEDEHGNLIDYTWSRTHFVETYTYDYTYTCKKLENHPIWMPGDPTATPPVPPYWVDNWVEVDRTCTERREASRSLPWYAREPYGASSNTSSPLLVTGRERLFGETLQLNELAPKGLCKYFSGRRWSGSHWWWPDRNTPDWWGSAVYPMGLYCQRYPYSRAFEDWRRAKVGADNARKNYDDTRAQYEKLKQEYDDMQDDDGSGGGPSMRMSFGAEASLEHADSRGSSGPQALP